MGPVRRHARRLPRAHRAPPPAGACCSSGTAGAPGTSPAAAGTPRRSTPPGCPPACRSPNSPRVRRCSSGAQHGSKRPSALTQASLPRNGHALPGARSSTAPRVQLVDVLQQHPAAAPAAGAPPRPGAPRAPPRSSGEMASGLRRIDSGLICAKCAHRWCPFTRSTPRLAANRTMSASSATLVSRKVSCKVTRHRCPPPPGVRVPLGDEGAQVLHHPLPARADHDGFLGLLRRSVPGDLHVRQDGHQPLGPLPRAPSGERCRSWSGSSAARASMHRSMISSKWS